jgi:hypothetical protein
LFVLVRFLLLGVNTFLFYFPIVAALCGHRLFARQTVCQVKAIARNIFALVLWECVFPVQLERRQIAEQRAKAGRPWWGALLGVLFVLGVSTFVFFAVRGLLAR